MVPAFSFTLHNNEATPKRGWHTIKSIAFLSDMGTSRRQSLQPTLPVSLGSNLDKAAIGLRSGHHLMHLYECAAFVLFILMDGPTSGRISSVGRLGSRQTAENFGSGGA